MSRERAGLYATLTALGATTFAALAAAVLFWGAADELDVRFVRWVHGASPEGLVELMRLATWLGNGVVLGTLTLAAVALLLRARRPAAALFVGLAFASSVATFNLLKAAFRRTRPELEDPFVQLTTYAFPSGHALASTATYGALALVLASLTPDPRRRAFVFACAATLVGVIVCSRVVLGAHYLLDVAAGVIGGATLLAFLLLVLERSRGPFLGFVLSPRNEHPQRARLDA
jgi:undecaprenyl-diphosphatase